MKSPYQRHRFPPEIISHAVWLYHRFTLSFRDVEDLLAERGIRVSYNAASSDRHTPANSGDERVDSGTSGTSTSCSSRSAANVIIFGEQWTRTEKFSIYWLRAGETNASLAGC